VNFEGPLRSAPLRLAVGPIAPGGLPRDPDPDGERQVATVRALLRLGAGTIPPSPQVLLTLKRYPVCHLSLSDTCALIR
jgi:hypothetical protein